jgi:hypothetical protein
MDALNRALGTLRTNGKGLIPHVAVLPNPERNRIVQRCPTEAGTYAKRGVDGPRRMKE